MRTLRQGIDQPASLRLAWFDVGIRLDERRLRVAVFAALAIVAALLILWLGRGHRFVQDEFDFLSRPPTLAGILAPHNEHLSALPVLMYQLLARTLDAGSYLPYLAVLMVAHVTSAAGLAAVIGGWRGVGAAAVLLFLGSGYENLFWAFQMGFVGSIAFGLWAMYLTGWRSSTMLALSLACSGIGLIFIVPVAITRWSRWLVVPIVGYLAWELVWGVSPERAAGVAQTFNWAVVGIGWAFGSIFAVPLVLGLGIAAAFAAFAVLHGDRLARVALLGLLSEYAVIAIARAAEPTSYSAAPRYAYVAAVFVLIMLTRSGLDRRLMWAALAIAFVVNVIALGPGSTAFV